MAKQIIVVAQIKACPSKGDLWANHRLLMTLLDGLVQHRPDVVVTPECFLDGYIATLETVTAKNITEYAVEPGTSPYVREVSRWAAANHCWVILGCTRLAAGGACNTALVFDRAGTLVGAYDKVHLQEHDSKFLAGRELPVFGSDFGPFGVMICADRRWPGVDPAPALVSCCWRVSDRKAMWPFDPGEHDGARARHKLSNRSGVSGIANQHGIASGVDRGRHAGDGRRLCVLGH